MYIALHFSSYHISVHVVQRISVMIFSFEIFPASLHDHLNNDHLNNDHLNNDHLNNDYLMCYLVTVALPAEAARQIEAQMNFKEYGSAIPLEEPHSNK